MSSPYVGEIRMFGGNFAPVGWALCQGQLLAISEFETLFNLIGTTYGGDGVSTFALPNLASRVPVHQGGTFVIGQLGGQETVTLTVPQLPSHNHVPLANGTAGQSAPTNNVWAQQASLNHFSSATPNLQNGKRRHWQCRRLATARQYAALPGRQFHHRAVWGISYSELAWR